MTFINNIEFNFL